MKICKSCEKELPDEFYAINKKASDGLYTYCKTCTKIKKREYLRDNENKTKALNYGREYREKNKEKLKLKISKYRIENREKINLARKKWRIKNPHKVNANLTEKQKLEGFKRLEQWRQENPEKKDIGRKTLRPKYVARIITRYNKNITTKDIPKELVEVKTIQLKIKRLLKVKQ